MRINKLTTFHLRLIGMLTMVIDHVGSFLFPRLTILKIIGRISFPIFAFLCAEAMHYSSKKERYIIVLAAFDIVISLVIYLFTGQNFGSVFSCLAISALIIYLLQNKRIWVRILSVIPFMYAIFASLHFTPIVMQYGIYGVLMIVGFYLIRRILTIYGEKNNIDNTSFNFPFYYSLCSTLYLVALSLISYNGSSFFETYLPSGGMSFRIQSYAFMSGIFILFYSGKKGYSSKWFKIFNYAFYPLHVLIILLIQIIMQMI